MKPCGRNMGHGLLCEAHYLCDVCKRVEELENKLAKKEPTRLHKDLLVEEIDKLRKNLRRCYNMIDKMMPGVAHIVLDIGELNQCMIETKLNMEASTPQEPIKHGKIFGG